MKRMLVAALLVACGPKIPRDAPAPWEASGLDWT
jgi:hypothetical protein